MLGSRYRLFGLLVSLFAVLVVGMKPSDAQTRVTPTAEASGEGTKAARVNNWTVAIAAGQYEGSFLRFASELGKALDDGDNLRILPMVTYGASENISDLLYLRGLDLAITHADVFDFYKKSGEVKNIDQRINYVSQMHNTEFYVLARAGINSLQDLAGKKVGFHIKGSGPSVTGPMIFERLGIKVEPVLLNHSLAVEKMKTGEIAAIFQLGAKPNDFLFKLKPEPGMRFLPLHWGQKFSDYYHPAKLTHDDYPNIIPRGESVDTLAVPVVLAVYNFPKKHDRYKRVERFIHYYFERFDKLKQPSFQPKWKEVNLTARVPGWNRYAVADEVLAALAKDVVARQANPKDPSSGVNATNTQLFEEFLAWRQKNKKN